MLCDENVVELVRLVVSYGWDESNPFVVSCVGLLECEKTDAYMLSSWCFIMVLMVNWRNIGCLGVQSRAKREGVVERVGRESGTIVEVVFRSELQICASNGLLIPRYVHNKDSSQNTRD